MTPAEIVLFGQFLGGVLTHPLLWAPDSTINRDTLWAWSNAETAPNSLLRWFNPMNTTEKWPRPPAAQTSRDSGAQPGTRDVQIYRTLQDGINATAYTLVVEPYYSAICANLRASLPRQQWGVYSTAATELHAWGTGSAWLNRLPYFGPLPVSIQGGFMPETERKIDELHALFIKESADPAGFAERGTLAYLMDGGVQLATILKAIQGLQASGLSPAQSQQLAHIESMLTGGLKGT